MKKLYLLLMVIACCGMAYAQKIMTPPSVMIVPDLLYCKSNGYVTTDANGTVVADYEKALSEDPSLHAVLTQIAQLIKERNSDIVVVDLIEAINSARADEAMILANGGDESESVDEAIIRNSNADILIKVQFDLIKNGPEYQVSYTLTGTDPYTNHNFAPVEGLGKPSTSTSPVKLLREAVYENMDNFLSMVLKHYQSMIEGGRMVSFDIKTRSTSAMNMNSKAGTYTLREEIEDFLYDNSVEGKGIENVKSGNTFMQYKGVYIPLVATIRGRQRKQGAKDVAQKLVNHLESKGISSEYKILGLGKIILYIN